MSEYFNPPKDLLPVSRAKSAQIKELKDSIVSAFDALPTDLVGIKTVVVAAMDGRPSLIIRLQEAEATTKGYRDEAETFANADTDTEVAPGKYSARHYMEKTAALTENLLTGPIFSFSTTSLDILVGAKSLVTDTGKTWVPGMWLLLLNRADPTAFMKGFIDSYNSGTGALTVTITTKTGIGTASDWLISQSTTIAVDSGESNLTTNLLFS